MLPTDNDYRAIKPPLAVVYGLATPPSTPTARSITMLSAGLYVPTIFLLAGSATSMRPFLTSSTTNFLPT